MTRLYVVVAGGLVLAFSSLASGQALDTTAPHIRVEHVRTFGGGPLPGHLLRPWGIAVDKDGFVLVADTDYGRIQVFDHDGTLIRILGSRGRGPGQFLALKAIATDADGDVYVADTGNHRIQVLTRTGAFVRMWGSEGSGPGLFRSRLGVAVSLDGQVFVTDAYNYRVQVFTREGQFIRMWGAKGNGPGQFRIRSSPATTAPGPGGWPSTATARCTVSRPVELPRAGVLRRRDLSARIRQPQDTGRCVEHATSDRRQQPVRKAEHADRRRDLAPTATCTSSPQA